MNHSLLCSIGFKTREEIWYGKPIDYSNLHICGGAKYIHSYIVKLEPRDIKCIFLGYTSQ